MYSTVFQGLGASGNPVKCHEGLWESQRTSDKCPEALRWGLGASGNPEKCLLEASGSLKGPLKSVLGGSWVSDGELESQGTLERVS